MASSSSTDSTTNPFVAAMAEAAKEVGLRYVSDQRPGISRGRVGKNFRYRGADGLRVSDQPTLARIKHLAIPPAWEKVWICPYDNGHIQAVGRDAKGRKQYRYHAEWRRQRDATKYDKMFAFGRALPGIRKKVQEDLALPGMGRESEERRGSLVVPFSIK